jgi:hypothetical protein
MKRRITFVLVVLMIVCVVTTASAYWTMYVYTSNGKPLNLRNAPSLAGDIMTSIPYGSAVRVNDVLDSYWYSVSYAGYTGYSMSRYLVYSMPTCAPWPYPTCVPYPYPTCAPWPYPTCTPTPTPIPTPYCSSFPNEIFYGFQSAYYTALVRPGNPAGYVNVRWAPSLQANIYARYYANDVLTVMSQNSLWCQVLDEDDQIMGYVMRQFLTPYYAEAYYSDSYYNPYDNEIYNGDS